jgi:hypothetical protein
VTLASTIAGKEQEAQKADIADQVLVNGCGEQGYWCCLIAFLNTYCGLDASINEIDRVPYLTEFASTTPFFYENDLCFDRKTPVLAFRTGTVIPGLAGDSPPKNA